MKKIFALLSIILFLSGISSARVPISAQGISRRDVHVSEQSTPFPSFWSHTKSNVAYVMGLGKMAIPKTAELLRVCMKNKDNIRRRIDKLQEIVRTEFMRSGTKFLMQSSELVHVIRDIGEEMKSVLYETTSTNIQ